MTTGILLEAGTNELEIVEFYIDEPDYRGYYGVNVAKVVEIIRQQPVTALPLMAHNAVLGAFPHRDGKVVPLVSLGRYLGKDSVDSTHSKIIVTEFNNVMTGFLVSGVNRIHRVSWTQVEDPGEFLQQVSQNTATGIVRLEERVVFILDLESVVADIDPSVAIKFAAGLPVALQTEKKLKLLHADDSANVRNLVKGLLEASGIFEIVQVNSGEDAWEYLENVCRNAELEGKTVTEFLQAVITDIEMPRMDGLTLCRKIKEDRYLRVLPVALFSSLITDKLAHRGEAVGADAQFAKPDLHHLSEKVYSLITGKQLTAS